MSKGKAVDWGSIHISNANEVGYCIVGTVLDNARAEQEAFREISLNDPLNLHIESISWLILSFLSHHHHWLSTLFPDIEFVRCVTLAVAVPCPAY